MEIRSGDNGSGEFVVEGYIDGDLEVTVVYLTSTGMIEIETPDYMSVGLPRNEFVKFFTQALRRIKRYEREENKRIAEENIIWD